MITADIELRDKRLLALHTQLELYSAWIPRETVRHLKGVLRPAIGQAIKRGVMQTVRIVVGDSCVIELCHPEHVDQYLRSVPIERSERMQRLALTARSTIKV